VWSAVVCAWPLSLGAICTPRSRSAWFGSCWWSSMSCPESSGMWRSSVLLEFVLWIGYPFGHRYLSDQVKDFEGSTAPSMAFISPARSAWACWVLVCTFSCGSVSSKFWESSTNSHPTIRMYCFVTGLSIDTPCPRVRIDSVIRELVSPQSKGPSGAPWRDPWYGFGYVR